MKTSELIEIARRCANRDAECEGCYANCDNCKKNPCPTCPFKPNALRRCNDNLIIALAGRLEMSYNELQRCTTCLSCSHLKGSECEIGIFECKPLGNAVYWQWRGDAE